MNNKLLNDLIVSVKSQNLQVLNVLVRQEGQIIAKHDFEEEKPAPLWSVSKTFTSMAVGIAISEGYFKMNDPVIDFFSDIPKVYLNEYLIKMTIHDLLCMGTGHAECPVVKADWGSDTSWDISQLFFEEPVIFEPGTHFTYNNSATYMLSKIISKTTGTNLDDYLDKRIFQQLDIPKPKWDTCPKGIPQGFAGLYLTAEQLSRFGQLILDQGVWQGKQLIPSSYIKQATSVQIQTKDFTPDFATADHQQGYGYHIWMNSYPNSYRMDGLYGQYVVMLPDKNAVVTYISNEPHNMTGVLELTWNTLIDKL
ncbi:serine hydrolase [Paenibacillus sp. P32E]|uniref:serine hydrolase domain-containing protein n=1 Tax=Paenibacillus sp. P32E TaxID=1349434 RepID=UPI00093EE294|nr:serine hydrolase [Paenibacillus sp. P32E]OKP92728.1 serine hydrolase [Paenibacillus sp. P32E]